VKPIDIDNIGLGIVRLKQNQGHTTVATKEQGSSALSIRNENQISDLLALVINASATDEEYQSRVEQIKQDIRSDVYTIDLERLIDNVLVFDYEF
jgi:anti-sigma28 factor (negative regulator of flagellin synthesis)